MALSLLCGGLGVAEATVHVNEGTGVTHEVYTTGETYSREVADAKLDLKADKNDVATNTANINNLDGKLSNLTTTVNGKADATAVTTALDSKADTDLSNLTAAGETKIKDTMSADMDLKANKADVNTALDGKADKATVTDLATKVGDASSGLVKDVADLKTQGNDLNTAIGNKADQSDLDAAKAKITTNETNITALQTKTTGLSADGKSLNSMNRVETDALKVTGEISNGAGVTTTLAKIDESMKQTETNKGDIANLKSKTDTQQTWIGRLNERTTQISYDPAKGTTVNGVDFMAAEVDAHGKGLTGVTTLNTTGDATIGGALTAAEVNAGTGAITGGSLSVIGAVNGISVNAGTLNTTGDATVGGDLSAKNTEINGTLHATGATTLDGALTAKGEAAFEKNVTMDQKLTVTGDTSLNKTDVNGALTAKGDVILGTNTAQTVTVNGIADFNEAVNMDNGLTVDKGLNVTSGESNLKNTTVDGTLSVNKETTLNGKLTAKDEATFTKKVTMEDDLEVKGELKTDKIAMENKKTDSDGTIHNSSTTITADGITHNGEVKKNGVTTESQFTHTEKGSETYAKKGDATDWTETRSDVTADGVKTEVKDSKGNRTNTSQTKEGINGFAIDEDGNSSTTSQTAKDINGNVTDKDGNKTDMKVTATENSIQIQDKDGKNTNLQVNTMGSSKTEITNGDGKTTKTEQTATDITNTAEQGTIKNDAMNIENNASGNITNNAQNGTITNDAKNIVNNASENITTTAKTMDTTVTGKATESYGELDTTVNGMEKHTVNGNQDIHVTGKQTNTVESGQENIISGGQTNTITGGQINNITGDQTTTVTGGDISNKAEKITNEANTELTDKVGTNTRVTTSTSITDTVGTANRKIENGTITDTAGDFTVTTDKANGTTFAKTGSTAYSAAMGAPKDTNIAGNLITTGRVNANELGVSDKDEHGNTADLSVKAEDGVKASASNGTTTGSLDVKAEEVSSSVKDASGKGSTFKQRIDAIMMESKDVSIKAEGTLTNEAKDIVTNASNSITEKVGETNVTTKTTTSSKSEIQNADTITSVQQTENMVQSYVGKKDGSATNVTTNFANASANMVTENGQSSTVLNNKDGLLVRNTANGSSFITADGTNTGAALEWTNVKGNEISAGKVEANYVKMDYADVMKDLGVHGNAKVDQNLEVGGTSTLKGDVTMESNAKVKKDLTVEGTTTTKTLKVTENAEIDGTLKVAKKATFEDSVSIAKDLSVGGDVTAKSYKVGDNTYIDANGIHANNQKITDVADGSISEGSKDAVNGGQLYNVKNDLEGKVNKVGANAAAMANLHPMEFDPDSKWNIAAAIGNYGSETAAALGAFYRPNDDVMVNLSTAFGTGENMVGGGVSVRLGKGGNKLSREETNALKAQVADLTARMDALLSVLNPNMSKDFPDVPENHWAYEAVSRLAGNDIVQGYPDGEFHGERTMTRYEMAEIIYNALSRGAEAERELVEEFKPELQAMAASEKATAERAEG